MCGSGDKLGVATKKGYLPTLHSLHRREPSTDVAPRKPGPRHSVLSRAALSKPNQNIQSFRQDFGLDAGLNFSTTRPGSVVGVRTGCGGGGGVGV